MRDPGLGIKHKYAGDTLTAKYAGVFEYNTSNILKRVSTSEGQLVPSGDTLRFDYFLKDHLGNVRVVFSEKGDILQQTDYYPFGLEIDRNSPIQTPAVRNGINRYNFLGKETQVSTGYIDLQARFYDPSIGRFFSIDPETEGQLEFSPYHYSFNNPIRFSDPDGKFACCGGPGSMLLTEAKSQWEAVKRNATTFANNAEQALGKALSYTDVNDAAVVTTMLTRGGNAVNLDGTNATTTDKVLATGGALVPLVGGSTLKKLGENISEIPAVKQIIDIFIDGNKHPESAKHLYEAIQNGASNEGVIDRAGASARRRENLSGTNTQRGMDRDEAPPAVINTGSASSVRHIPSSDNRGAGASIGQQLKQLPDGTRVRILPKIENP